MPKEHSAPTISANTFGISQEEFNLHLGPILASGMMPSKAAWLEVHMVDLLFPLDAELRASIPDYLPGEVPKSETELYAALQDLPKQS